MIDYIFVFVFGTIVGSFLNVVIIRYNTGESFFKGKSKCLHCGKKLNWYELIPLISFAIQKRKCHECKSKISWQYPIVEIITGIVFVLIAQKLDFSFAYNSLLVAGPYFAIFSLLIVIAIYDFYHKIIPDTLVYLFNGMAFLSLFQVSSFKFQVSSFLAGCAFFLFFGLFWLVSRGKWMGLGDAKLALGIGWFLGAGKGITALLFSFWIGGAVGILLVILNTKKYNFKSSVPFGPFLVFASLLAFLLNGII